MEMIIDGRWGAGGYRLTRLTPLSLIRLGGSQEDAVTHTQEEEGEEKRRSPTVCEIPWGF